MSSEILISYLIPLYNCGSYIERCIQSIENQHNGGGYEIIVVDDGSTDGGGDIVAELQKSNSAIKLIRQSNWGVSKARNIALNNASGKYIYCIDADDVMISNVMNDRILYMEENDIDVLYNSVINVHSEYKNLAKIFKRDSPFKRGELRTISSTDFLCGVLTKTNLVYLPAYIIRRSLIENNSIRFRENIVINEDMLFVMEIMAKTSQVIVSPSPIYLYLFYENSSCRRIRTYEENLKIWIDVSLALSEIVDNNSIYSSRSLAPLISESIDYHVFSYILKRMLRDVVPPSECICAIHKLKSLNLYPIDKCPKGFKISAIERILWRLSRHNYVWICVVAFYNVYRAIFPNKVNNKRLSHR